MALPDDGPCLICGEYDGAHTPGCCAAPMADSAPIWIARPLRIPED